MWLSTRSLRDLCKEQGKHAIRVGKVPQLGALRSDLGDLPAQFLLQRLFERNTHCSLQNNELERTPYKWA